MQIETCAPFRISKDPDGAQHAVKDAIQITVTADLGDVVLNHRVGTKPDAGPDSRWLHAHLQDHGVHVFVSGTHVVVTAKDYLPTFNDLQTPQELMDEALLYMRPEMDGAGRHVVDTENNRRVLLRLFDLVRDQEQNRVMAWIKHAIANICR